MSRRTVCTAAGSSDSRRNRKRRRPLDLLRQGTRESRWRYQDDERHDVRPVVVDVAAAPATRVRSTSRRTGTTPRGRFRPGAAATKLCRGAARRAFAPRRGMPQSALRPTRGAVCAVPGVVAGEEGRAVPERFPGGHRTSAAECQNVFRSLLAQRSKSSPVCSKTSDAQRWICKNSANFITTGASISTSRISTFPPCSACRENLGFGPFGQRCWKLVTA